MSPSPNLTLVAISPDAPELSQDLEKLLEALFRGGVTSFMYREKRLSDAEFFAQAKDLKALCDAHDCSFILNERVDLAEPLGADIVHLTWKSRLLTPADHGGKTIFGKSVHNLSEVEDAKQLGANYLIAGPVFDTPSKAGLVDSIGEAGLREIVNTWQKPVVAVGGLTETGLLSVKKAGAVGAAAITSLFRANDPEAAARAMSAEWMNA